MIYEIKPLPTRDDGVFEYAYSATNAQIDPEDERRYGQLDQVFSEQGLFRTGRPELAIAAVLVLHDHERIITPVAISMLMRFWQIDWSN